MWNAVLFTMSDGCQLIITVSEMEANVAVLTLQGSQQQSLIPHLWGW